MLFFGKLALLLKQTFCLVDVCLGVLIILVYYTVLFYTCDRYQENQICPLKNLAFQLHQKKILLAEMYIKYKACYIEDSVTKIFKI